MSIYFINKESKAPVKPGFLILMGEGGFEPPK